MTEKAKVTLSTLIAIVVLSTAHFAFAGTGIYNNDIQWTCSANNEYFRIFNHNGATIRPFSAATGTEGSSTMEYLIGGLIWDEATYNAANGGLGLTYTSGCASNPHSAFYGFVVESGIDSYANFRTYVRTGVGSYTTFGIAAENVAANDTSTHIISLTPAASSTQSSPVTIQFHAYINPNDIGWVSDRRIVLTLVDQNSLFNFTSHTLYNELATTSGDIYFSTTTALANGNYAVNSGLIQTYFGGLITGTRLSDPQLANQFIVGSATFAGTVLQSLSSVNSYINGLPATTTTALAGSCNPLGSFSIIECFAFLLVPDPTISSSFVQDIQDNFLDKAPFGYAKRFVAILTNNATTSTSTLPSLTFTLPVGYPGGGQVATIGVFNNLLGTGTLLTNAQNPNTGHHIRDIVEVGWDSFVYLLFAVALSGEILGIGGKVISRL